MKKTPDVSIDVGPNYVLLLQNYNKLHNAVLK